MAAAARFFHHRRIRRFRMAFPFNPSPTFDAPARITIAGQDQPTEMRVTWRHKTRAEMDAFLGKPATLAKEGKTLSDGEYLTEVMVAWDVVGDDGIPVELTAKTLDEFIGLHQPAGAELLDTYITALVESRSKN
jgi:hypothetical protein